MCRSFCFLEKRSNIIIRAAAPGAAEIERLYLERGGLPGGLTPRESGSQILVHHDLEGTAALARFGLQPSRNVIIESKCGTHVIMMIYLTHHDVNALVI